MFEFHLVRGPQNYLPIPPLPFPNKRLFGHALVVAIVLCNDIESDMYVYSSRLREMIDGIENTNCAHEEEEKEERRRTMMTWLSVPVS